MSFSSALCRKPPKNFGDGITTCSDPPNSDLFLQQYFAYVNTLRDVGLEVVVVEDNEAFPDSHYVEDPIVLYRELAFVCRSSTKSRFGEGESLLPFLKEKRIVRLTEDDAFIDGGDVLFCHERVLIGISNRTNEAGAIQLKNALLTVQSDLLVDFVPFQGCLHLKTGLTELAPLVLVRSPDFITDYSFDWAKEVIMLPDEEHTFSNVLPVNGKLMIEKGSNFLLASAQRFYTSVIELDMSENVKMDGGLTCLSLRY